MIKLNYDSISEKILEALEQEKELKLNKIQNYLYKVGVFHVDLVIKNLLKNLVNKGIILQNECQKGLSKYTTYKLKGEK